MRTTAAPCAAAAREPRCRALSRRTPVNEPRIVKVWIESGCISCQLCQDTAPDVFLVQDGNECVVRADAGARFGDLAEEIEQAAGDCPVEVIKFERVG